MVKGVDHPVACRPQLETILLRRKNKPLKGWSSPSLASCGGHLATVQRDGEHGWRPGRPHHVTHREGNGQSRDFQSMRRSLMLSTS